MHTVESVHMIKWCIEFLVNKRSAVRVQYMHMLMLMLIRCCLCHPMRQHVRSKTTRILDSERQPMDTVVVPHWVNQSLFTKTCPAVCSDPNCSHKPTAEGQEAVISIELWVNQAVDQSVIESVCWRSSVESVWGLCHRARLWSLPESVWHHSLLPQAHTHTHTHIYKYTPTHMLSHTPALASRSGGFQIPSSRLKGRW